ncbi:MAG: hypothetical protein GC190_10780 [Alphaproteobacteria bacterium]|nr:hypothetical protein [Alphaproteobacteria bacterium]
MADSTAENHLVSNLGRRVTMLAGVTAIAAVAATLAVGATAQWSPDYLLPVAIVGLVVTAALAIAATLQLRSNVRAAALVEDENAALIADYEATTTANLARARFVADISHDLRQPLHALGLFLDALERRVTPGEGEKILAKTREASGVLTRSFNALIDLTRVEADALIPEVELLSVDDVLTRLDDECSAASLNVGVDLRVVHTHAHVVADERLLSHILRTLLANASDDGPGRLLLGVRHRGNTISIELHCSSPGKHDGKWDVLNAVDPTHPASRNAQELDLLVVRRLADLMGLRLRHVSKADRGMMISLALADARESGDASLKGRAVLLVTQDAATRLAGASALACAGAVVHAASNMRQADHVAKNSRFELLVTNIASDDPATREARAKLEAAAPYLPNATPIDRLVAAASAKLAS